MEFNTLTKSIEEYRWAIREMGKCPTLSPLEVTTLVELALAAEEGMEAFNEARISMMLYRTAVIASIIGKCTEHGFPMEWPNAAQDQV